MTCISLRRSVIGFRVSSWNAQSVDDMLTKVLAATRSDEPTPIVFDEDIRTEAEAIALADNPTFGSRGST